MSNLQTVLQALFDLNQIWWLVANTVFWFVVVLIILIKTDKPDPAKSFKDLKSTLGFFFLFTLVSTGLIYFLFGQVPT
jgi:hypothetical protein